MLSLLTAFLLDHFDASIGWWWAYGLLFALDFAAILAKAAAR